MQRDNISRIKETLDSKSTFIFDFDGVLADSLDIKTWAFGEIYRGYGTKVVQKVKNHHKQNGGISRYDKFIYYHMAYLGIKLDKIELEEICNSFSKLVMDAVIRSPEIKGASKFLDKYCVNNKLSFINSATPQSEIEEIANKRQIDKYFESIYGSPETKLQNLEKIFNNHNTSPNRTVFFGDALSDYNAAVESGCDFIGIGDDIKSNLLGSGQTLSSKIHFSKNFIEIV